MGFYSDALQKALADGHIDSNELRQRGFANGAAAQPKRPANGIVSSSLSPFFADQVTGLQERIEYLQGKKLTRMIALCGCDGREGTSTIVHQLAIAYALTGLRARKMKGDRRSGCYSGNRVHNTLVIDANLHSPRLHQLFGRSREQGVTEYVLQGMELEQCTKWLHVQDTALISAGIGAQSVSDIFKSPRFTGLLKRAEGAFSTVILDCAAVTLHPDVLALLSYIDGVVLIARPYSTPLEKLQRAREIIESRNGRVFGVVLNRSPQA